MQRIALFIVLASFASGCAGTGTWGNYIIRATDTWVDGEMQTCLLEVNTGMEQTAAKFAMNKKANCEVDITYNASTMDAVESHKAAADVYKEGIKDATGLGGKAIDILPSVVNPAGVLLGGNK